MFLREHLNLKSYLRISLGDVQVTFKRKLSDVVHTLAQVFTFESQLDKQNELYTRKFTFTHSEL